MAEFYMRNRAAILVIDDLHDDGKAELGELMSATEYEVQQTTNVLVPDSESVGIPAYPEDKVVGRELWLNEEQFYFVCRMIITDNRVWEDVASTLAYTAGRWIFTRTSNSFYWMMKLAARLDEDNWDGYDPALALRCYEHAVWCETRPNCMPDANDCAEAVTRNPREEINRLKSELEFPGYFDDFLEDDFNFSGQRNVVELRIPEGTHRIPSGAFRGCRNLRSIYIPDSVVEIGEDAFAGCPQLISRPHYTQDGTCLIAWPNAPESVVVSPYAQVIGIGAFCQSRDLRDVIYTPSALAIDGCDAYFFAILANAFAGCENLRRFDAGSCVRDMNPRDLARRGDVRSVLLGPAAFRGCRSLERFTPHWEAEESVWIELVDWLGMSISSLLPRSHGMYELDDGHPANSPIEPFAGCEALREIAPAVLSYRCKRLFAGCQALTDVTLIDRGEGSISEEMFSGCTSLSHVSICGVDEAPLEPRTMRVGSRAFDGCRALMNEGINISELRHDSPENALEESSLTIPREPEDGGEDDEDGDGL